MLLHLLFSLFRFSAFQLFFAGMLPPLMRAANFFTAAPERC